MEFFCLSCGANAVTWFEEHGLLAGVSSDVRPWPRAGIWGACRCCGLVQKRLDDIWRKDVDAIYSGYSMYPLSQGCEQVVFAGGAPIPRTVRLLEQLQRAVPLPPGGRLLDIGCGNGALLRSFAAVHPGWRLSGYEQNAVNRELILSLPGVEDFFCGSLDTVSGTYDLVTLIYVIEHLTDPVGVLRAVRKLLRPGGQVFLQTVNFLESPFDLVVVDHCSHFSLTTLGSMMAQADFSQYLQDDSWIAKEIGIVGAPGGEPPAPLSREAAKTVVDQTARSLAWLEETAAAARQAAARGRFGIFGTAIAGTWLAAMTGEAAAFFVDEDPLRRGRVHLGRPVMAPSDVPAGSTVYLGFPEPLAKGLAARLTALHPDVRFLCPPPLALHA